MFNIAQVPFSYYGSYMSLVLKRKDRLWMCNHHNSLNDLFILTPLAGDQPVDVTYTETPECLTLESDAGKIEVCFESTGTIRMRGTGLSLQVASHKKVVAYSEAPQLATMNLRHALRRYQFEALQGTVTIDGAYGEQTGTGEDAFEKTKGLASVLVTPDKDGVFEIAVDEYWSTWEQPERKPFDECLSAAKTAFTEFLDSMPSAPAEHEQARTLAAYINWATTVEPCGLLKRDTMLMSKNWMCSIWSWDQCFNAMAVAAGQPQLALDQMLVLVDHQDEFGSYPDAINDLTIHYNYSKPPVHGWAFSEILKRMPTPPSRDVMTTMYESLSAQANWWMRYRRQAERTNVQQPTSNNQHPSGDGKHRSALPYYLHGNDSGWDNSTMFDRGVPLIAPDLSALLVRQMDTLSTLAAELGRTDESTDWKARADALLSAMLDELWQGDHFAAKLAADGSVVENQSLIPWLPIILGKRLPEDILKILAQGIEKHLTEWGLATELVTSPEYQPDGYWRGPIWAPATYIAVAGLYASGFTDLADTVSERFCKLCSKSGFAENYDAVTGASLRDPAYTWTASVFLLVADRAS